MDRQLLRAVIEGHLPTVRRILQQPGGVNVNAADVANGLTALYLAVIRGHVAILRAILQAEGANANARTVDGWTPLHMAFRLTDGDRLLLMIQALLDAGADPNAVDDYGCTPLFLGIRNFCPISAVEALLGGGANPAAPDNNLDTPLHQACYSRRLDVAQLLIQRQGSECLTLKNNLGETPLDRLAQDRSGISGRATVSIRQHILQTYAGMVAQRDGLLCLHSVLQVATFIEGNDEEFQLPVGKLNTEYLQILLGYIFAAEPGSVRALDRDGLLPLQVARQLNFPDLVLNVLLRPYPDALLLL